MENENTVRPNTDSLHPEQAKDHQNNNSHKRTVFNLFTRKDLDGAGCSVIAHLYAMTHCDAITVKYCNNTDVNQEVNQLLDYIDMAKHVSLDPSTHRDIFIVGLSLDADTANRLDTFVRRYEDVSVILLDRRDESADRSRREWTHIFPLVPFFDSTTEMMYFCLSSPKTSPWNTASLHSFVQDIRLYNTVPFMGLTELNYDNLSILLDLVGADEFVSMLVSWITDHPDTPFNVEEMEYYPFIEYSRRQRKEYCKTRSLFTKKIPYKGKTMAVTLADKYVPLVADCLLDQNPDASLAAVITLPDSVYIKLRQYPDRSESITCRLTEIPEPFWDSLIQTIWDSTDCL